jgi:hypothetical protein
MKRLLVFVASCLAPPVESPVTTVVQETDVTVRPPKNKVDVLFMIDNSNSMDPMQLELRSRFGDFFTVFEALAATGTYADMHIGVVTSDYGAGDTAAGNCQTSPGGQRGILQTLPSAKATNPPANCKPPNGAPYIAYAFGAGGATTNLPNGNDSAALVAEFTCMASVGASGCGFEHQLEAVYAALHNQNENAGFLRDDALLTVVFVTNEDDGSAPPTAQFYRPVNDPAGGGPYGQYNTYRQTRFAVDCGGTAIPYGMPVGPLADCAAIPNPMVNGNAAFDISRYIDFFTQPSPAGVKADPGDVILVGIDGPETPFSTVLADPNSLTPYTACAAPLLSASCMEALQHSCENNVQPGFFGDPAVRLNAVINAAGKHNISSICGDDLGKTPDFTNALQQLALLIKKSLGVACLSSPITDPANPDCVVEDRSDADNSVVDSVASCASTNDAQPCWKYVENDKCTPVVNPVNNTVTQGSIAIERDPSMVPPHTHLHVACATIAHTSGGTPSPSP